MQRRWGAGTQGEGAASTASRANARQSLREVAARTEPPDAGLCGKLSRAALELANYEDAYQWLLRAASGSGPLVGWPSAAALLQKLEAAGPRPARCEIRVALAGSYTTSQFAHCFVLGHFAGGIYLHLIDGDFDSCARWCSTRRVQCMSSNPIM